MKPNHWYPQELGSKRASPFKQHTACLFLAQLGQAELLMCIRHWHFEQVIVNKFAILQFNTSAIRSDTTLICRKLRFDIHLVWKYTPRQPSVYAANLFMFLRQVVSNTAGRI